MAKIAKLNRNPSKNFLYQGGFTMVSNLLFDYQSQLNITDDELLFIIRLYKYATLKNYKIHDEQLDPTVSSKTLQRRRKSLHDKGLLNYTILKGTMDDGSISTLGISYDLSPLEMMLYAISNKTAEEELKEIYEKEKDVVLENDDSEPDELDFNLKTYVDDFEEYYNTEYVLTEKEKEFYNGLIEEDKERIGMIIKVFRYTNEIKKVMPRLSLFMGTQWRMDKLRNDIRFIRENDPYMVNFSKEK